jgi:hypothetical protein
LVVGIVACVAIAGAIAAAVVLAGGGKPIAGRSSGHGAVVPPGWTVHRDEASGFAIAFPNTWVDATDLVREGVSEGADYLKFAVAEGSGSGTNVNVVMESIPGFDVEAYARVNERQLTSFGIMDLSKSSESIPAGQAVVFTYTTMPSAGGAHLVQYFLVHGSHGYVITFFPEPGRTFDPSLIRQFVSSFELFD